jgi:hypothetical protein
MGTTAVNILALALAAPLAFAQNTEETVSPDLITTYEPGKIIVVGSDRTAETYSCVLDKSIHYVSKDGEDIDEHLIKPGTCIHIHFENAGPSQLIERVVVDED